MTTDAAASADATEAVVRRLARPHPSGGMVIERSVILAEGAHSAAILSWISGHHGVADSSSPSARNRGLHGQRFGEPAPDAPARRFVLPARAFTAAPGGPGGPETAPGTSVGSDLTTKS